MNQNTTGPAGLHEWESGSSKEKPKLGWTVVRNRTACTSALVASERGIHSIHPRVIEDGKRTPERRGEQQVMFRRYGTH